MTWQSGGGGGIKGVTSDNQTPGGEVIAGALQAGNLAATDVPAFHYLNGVTWFQDTPANQVDDDDTVRMFQSQPLQGDITRRVLLLARTGTLNGHDYTQPVLEVVDNTATTAPLFGVTRGGVRQLQVDSDGVQVHGKLKTGASATHTLGAYSGKSVPIYDEAGTLLGYMPLYA